MMQLCHQLSRQRRLRRQLASQRWSTASYLRKYPVLEDEVYDQALKAVLGEFAAGDSQPNLFVHQMQQASLFHQAGKRHFLGEE